MGKSKLWGVMRQLDEAQLGEFRRHYAHFHRVLGPLLVELGEQPGTLWLEGAERHVLTGEGEENRYARAIYPLHDLEPYRERLAELEKVQAAGQKLLGGGESPRGLLPPKVVEGVRHLRISRHPNYVTTLLSHAGAVERLDALLAATRVNLREFEPYASAVDPKREQLEAEVKAIEEALEVVRATPDERFRFRAHAVRVRPYLYPLQGDPYQIDTRKHGLVLVGPHVTVVQDDPTRKVRSDKKLRTPLLELPALQVYAESEWQEKGE